MYKYSVPISVESFVKCDREQLVAKLLAASIKRVFLSVLDPIYTKECSLYTQKDDIPGLIEMLHSCGIEVGIWVCGFGHGGILSHQSENAEMGTYQEVMGADGKISSGSFCPLDANFAEAYLRGIKAAAEFYPDLIMLDDDYRLNMRGYSMGCACPLHMDMLCERLGEKIEREDLAQAVFSNGENKYRSAWLDVMGETLTEFAGKIRKCVDEIDPEIRVGICACYDTWDYSGDDALSVTNTLAGDTRPFMRTIGAPYYWPKVMTAVELTRMQAAWCKDSGVELFAEGDVYPRPRYRCPARLLEMFDMALLVTGEVDGCLKYMYCYDRDIEYEKGYINAHCRNDDLRQKLSELFYQKRTVGVRIFEEMHKIRTWELPDGGDCETADLMLDSFHSRASRILSQNSIPTVYDGTDMPVAVFGENAAHIPTDLLKFGAFLDAKAAEILAKRGIDTGLIAVSKGKFDYETYGNIEDRFAVGPQLCQMEISPEAEITSRLFPGAFPGSYRYENRDGQRFFVLALDAYGRKYSEKGTYDYYNGYHRQDQLTEALEWIRRRPLPAVCRHNPSLYTITAKSTDEKRMSVALFNIFCDEIVPAEIALDREYESIRFINCCGKMAGRSIVIDEIPPYGVAAFEVW